MSNLLNFFSNYFQRLFNKAFSNIRINGIPITGERRNRPIALNAFLTKKMAANAINRAIDKEYESAQDKITKSYNWGDVGYIEMQVINQIKSIIQNHDQIESPQEYVMACHNSFEHIVSEWQNNHQDVDGYGLATIRIIKQVLELH